MTLMVNILCLYVATSSFFLLRNLFFIMKMEKIQRPNNETGQKLTQHDETYYQRVIPSSINNAIFSIIGVALIVILLVFYYL